MQAEESLGYLAYAEATRIYKSTVD
jgi:hypothetical protein